MKGRTETRICKQCQKPFAFELWRIKQEKNPGQFCSRECKNASQNVDLIDRFQSNLSKPTAAGCIEWTGTANDEYGYGRIHTGRGSRKMVYAHRLSWELANGPIPKGELVCHTCDNPCCVNPAHLFLGKHKDNSEDMARKKRHAYGERQKSAKLSDAKVREILKSYRAGNITQTELAARHGVNKTTIRMIVIGKSWTHVTDP